ncbi:MAG: protein-L-isoaspartate(D-aspartate) O-methyltransferase [Rhizobiaceae bacterium]
MNYRQEPFPEAIVALMLRLREFGIVDPQYLKIVESVPHEQFVPVQHFEQAWKPQVLPIACGQTMVPIDATVRMVDALNLDQNHAVLEIGTGTGFQTALLAKLARKVYSVDRYQSLLDDAKERLDRLGIGNVTLAQADGASSLVGQGLYDRIITDLAYETIPRYLLEQLVTGGIVVTAIGEPFGEQTVVRLTKVGSRFEREDLFPVRFGRFESGIARVL